MALVEISNFRGTPKLRCRVPNGTLFYDWLAANDATFHRDLLIVRNGVKLGDDDELAFELSELDHIQIFDQPKGIVGDILSPIFKVVGGSFRSWRRNRLSRTAAAIQSTHPTIA